MNALVDEQLALVRALQLTADPPEPWIDAAALIPSTLGDLDALERLLASDAFRERFGREPEVALREAGLPASEPVLAAVRDRLA